jgi:hypothetical protein
MDAEQNSLSWEDSACDRIPVIDIDCFTNNNTSDETLEEKKRTTANQIREACLTFGFFYVSVGN